MYLSQLEGYGFGDVAYETVVRVFKPASFVVTDGAPTTLAGRFEDVPQKDVKVHWDPGAFKGLVSLIHPGAVLDDFPVTVSADPGGTGRSTGQSPTLMHLTGDGASPLVEVSATYGNPYPTSFGVIASAWLYASRAFTLPNDPTPRTQKAFVMASAPIGPNGPIVLSPVVTPPMSLRINATLATADLTGVGASPIISWERPKKGAPRRYEVQIFYVDPAVATPRPVSTIMTSGRSVVIPPGVLQSGSYYTVGVTAELGAGMTIVAPFKSDHGSRATVLSGLFKP
jgi:hypothetical protein